MKKLTLIMLVAMVPLLTMAQKRGKKDKTETTQKNKTLKTSYEFMVITGRTMMNRNTENPSSTSSDIRAEMANRMKITFDLGGVGNNDSEDLSQQQYKSMAHAVNTAARLGWEFVNANVYLHKGATVHYYYMRKQK